MEIVPGAGHFPHEEFPDRFAGLLTDFVRNTPPSGYDANRWRSLLRSGGEQRWTSGARPGLGGDELVDSPA
jgi:hypothetical protein